MNANFACFPWMSVLYGSLIVVLLLFFVRFVGIY